MQTKTISDDLIQASAKGDTEEVRWLLEQGAEVNGQNEKGQTALMLATLNNHYKIVELLIEAGSDVNVRDHNKLTPFIASGSNGFFEILELMAKNGADLDSFNQFGGTALIPAAEKGYLRAVQSAIKVGVPVNHVNHLGWSALLEAVILGDGGYLYRDIVEELVQAGANVELKDHGGESAIDYAKKFHQNLVGLILEGEKVDANPTITEVKQLVKGNELDEAYARIEAALANDLNNEALLYYKAYLLAEKKEYTLSNEVYQQLIEQTPESLEFYFYQALNYRRLNESEDALKSFNKAIEANPTRLVYRYHKTNYLRELGKHEEVIRETSKLLEQDPNRYDFLFHKANSLRALGRHEEAIETIEKAVKLDPGNTLYPNHIEESKLLLNKQKKEG